MSWESALGSIGGSLVGGLFGMDAAGDAEDMLEAYAALAQPLTSYTNPLGEWSYDEATRTGSTALSGPFANLLSQFQMEAQQDPTIRAQQELDILRQISAPREEEQRERMRERLFSQGRLGTAAGLRELEGMEEAIQLANLQRELGALDRGYSARQEAWGNAFQLATGTQNLSQVGMTPMMAMGPQAMGLLDQAATLGPSWQASFGSALGSGIGSLATNLFSPNTINTSTPAAAPGFWSQF